MEPPHVAVTPEAAAWLRKRGGVFTLRRSPKHGCCGGRVAIAVAEAGAPRDEAGFVRHDLGTLTLFVQPDLEGPLRVGLDRLFGLGALYVEGAEAEM